MTPVRLEPAALGSRVKHSTTEPGHNTVLIMRFEPATYYVPHHPTPVNLRWPIHLPHTLHTNIRESDTSAHVLLNLLRELGIRDKIRGLQSILSFSGSESMNSLKQRHFSMQSSRFCHMYAT